MAKTRKSKRKSSRRPVRRATRRAARRVAVVVRRAKRRRSRRPAARMAAPSRRRSRSSRRPKGLGLVAGLASGVGGAVGMAALLGRITSISPMAKAFVATGAGIGAYLTLPKRMKIARAASVGAALGGALSLTRQTVPTVPMLAGIDDIGMGVNIRPSATLSQNARRQQYLAAKRNTVQAMIPSSRNAQFMGSAGAQWGKFQTPADY